MKRALRRTTAGVSVIYSEGNFSNNLTGADFALEESEACICLSIDLSGNLRVRNKESNCYYDACELAEQHSSLKSVQVDDRQVTDGLAAALRRTPNARWELRLLLGEKGTFKYSVTVTRKKSSNSIFLNVC